MAARKETIARKELIFSEAETDIYEFFDKMPGAFAKNVKQAMRAYMVREEFRVDYDRIRRIVEEAIVENAVTGLSAEELEAKKNKPEKSFFGLGKTF